MTVKLSKLSLPNITAKIIPNDNQQYSLKSVTEFSLVFASPG